MKQIVVLSGKGGTGKTSLSAALAHLASGEDHARPAILVDADVDAANLELLLAPQVLKQEEFWGGHKAWINPELCTACGNCLEVCRFDAILETDSGYLVDSVACEGCAACRYQCPGAAIEMQPALAGEWFFSSSRYGPLFHAALRPGQENSGKLVTLIKRHAQMLANAEWDHFEITLTDGPPGIGCPVIAACSQANLALIVAEPSVSGVHDLERILATVEHFKLPACVCLNKADLSPRLAEEISDLCQKKELPLMGKIPYDPFLSEAMLHGQPVTVYAPESPSSQAIAALWNQIRAL